MAEKREHNEHRSDIVFIKETLKEIKESHNSFYTKINKEIYGNGSIGIKDRLTKLETKSEEKKYGFKNNISIISVLISMLMCGIAIIGIHKKG